MAIFFNMNGSAVIRCDWCRHVFPECELIDRGFSYPEICPFCGGEEFTVIQIGDNWRRHTT